MDAGKFNDEVRELWESKADATLTWRHFQHIPPVIVARMRKIQEGHALP